MRNLKNRSGGRREKVEEAAEAVVEGAVEGAREAGMDVLASVKIAAKFCPMSVFCFYVLYPNIF